MTLEIINETENFAQFDYEALFSKVINEACDYVKCPYEVSVNILLTNDDEIQQINLSERNIDKPTDVLSFPMLEYDTAGNFDFITDEDFYYFDPDSGELMLGDIVISLETATKQAEEYGHSFTREIAFLCAHSMLHLFGFDHMKDEERIEMERMQKEILEGINITRDHE